MPYKSWQVTLVACSCMRGILSGWSDCSFETTCQKVLRRPGGMISSRWMRDDIGVQIATQDLKSTDGEGTGDGDEGSTKPTKHVIQLKAKVPLGRSFSTLNYHNAVASFFDMRVQLELRPVHHSRCGTSSIPGFVWSTHVRILICC